VRIATRQLEGKADGKAISEMVKKLLSSKKKLHFRNIFSESFARKFTKKIAIGLDRFLSELQPIAIFHIYHRKDTTSPGLKV
jgi:hypothetical protein